MKKEKSVCLFAPLTLRTELCWNKPFSKAGTQPEVVDQLMIHFAGDAIQACRQALQG